MLCCKTDIGIFNSDTLHNIIYTFMIFNKYKKKLDICLNKYDKTKQINEIFKLELAVVLFFMVASALFRMTI